MTGDFRSQPNLVDTLRSHLVTFGAMDAAADRIEALEAALRKSETALGKVAAWLGRLATAAEQRAKDKRFQSLADANAADAKNYRSTIVSIMPALEGARASLKQEPGT